MSSRLLLVDSGGVSRQLRRLLMVDSGGTTRNIRRLFMVDAGGTARRVFVYALLEATITVGNSGNVYGYNTGLYGALSPDTYTDNGANSRQIIIAQWDTSSDAMQLAISGASVPDTDTSFGSIVVNGYTFTRASRTSYNGSAGGGTYSLWTWQGTGLVASLPTGGSASLVVTP